MSETNNTVDVKKALRGVLEVNLSALQGLLDKMPEGMRGDLKVMKDRLNEQLEKLGPIDQVPLAQSAGWALEAFESTAQRLTELAKTAMDRLTGISTELTSRVSAYQSLEADTKDLKKFVPAETVKTMCETARQQGVDSLMPMIVGMRKTQTELAGLPIPSEDVLKLDAPGFEAAFTAAKGNLAKCKTKGWSVGGKGSRLIQEKVWLKAEEFAGQLASIEELIGGTSPRVEPLMGGGGGGGGGETETKTKEGGRRLRFL